MTYPLSGQLLVFCVVYGNSRELLSKKLPFWLLSQPQNAKFTQFFLMDVVCSIFCCCILRGKFRKE